MTRGVRSETTPISPGRKGCGPSSDRKEAKPRKDWRSLAFACTSDATKMDAVGITESAKGDNKKFEIWCNSREEVFIVQAATPDIKSLWVNEIRKVLTGQLNAYRESSQKKASDPTTPSPTTTNPSMGLRNSQKSVKKGEEKKTDAVISDQNTSSPKQKEEPVTSPTTDRASVAKKRFTLQGFSNLKSQKATGSPLSPDHKAKRHEIKSDPTPFGFKGILTDPYVRPIYSTSVSHWPVHLPHHDLT
ncbi:hypothetical protein DPEC_G00362550 [Dallia pectoralis]|nr:hypothetical protein DPEC_G00362550 [Dallia pectoralis]